MIKTTIDINDLTDKDVRYLIKSLKEPNSSLEIEAIKNKLLTLDVQKIKEDTIVLGIVDNIEYILHVFTTKYLHYDRRYSIHLRFAANHEHLIRVDVGDSSHNNPTGYPKCGKVDHVHFYRQDIEPHDAIAIPLSECDFPNIQNIVEAFDEFLNYNNINSN